MPHTSPSISIIIPTLNEAAALPRTLDSVARVRGEIEVLVVDGGSVDGTAEIAARYNAPVIACAKGRGVQLDAGARAASGEVLWFLHADTHPPENAAEAILQALARSDAAGGNFHLVFDGQSRSARLLTRIYPRLRWLGLSYGDAGIFVRRDVYHRAGGFRHYPLFEDLEFIRRLRRNGRFVHLDCALRTSSRRFNDRTFAYTFACWTLLQILYWLGVSPHILARFYGPVR